MKVASILQLAPGDNELPQLFVCPKSTLAVIWLMESATEPQLVNVMDWPMLVVPNFWPPNDMLPGESLAHGTTPVPLSVAVCGLPGALSVTLSVPERSPAAVGLKVTLIMQLVFTGRELAQLFVCA